MTVHTDPANQLRRYNRYPLSVEFKLSDATDPVHGEILFDTVNVSAGGAFLRSDLLMDIGAEVDVAFSVPGQDETFTTTGSRTTTDESSVSCGIVEFNFLLSKILTL